MSDEQIIQIREMAVAIRVGQASDCILCGEGEEQTG